MLAALTIGVSCVWWQTRSRRPKVVLVTHDSFAVSDDVKAAFERESGLKLQILKSGDAGAALTTALLTAGNPQGDVFFGVDNNLLSRALDGDLFDAYESPALAGVDEKYVLDPEHRVTPIDHGEVCLNYDKAWFAEHGVAPPRSLDDLTKAPLRRTARRREPERRRRRVSRSCSRRSRATARTAGRTTGRSSASATCSSSTAGRRRTTCASRAPRGKGSRPIVVSYASSPPAEVIFRTPRPEQAPTAVVEDSCFRQIELAGVLRGARNEAARRELIDFMLSKRFQEDMPLTMFVFPVSPRRRAAARVREVRGRARRSARPPAGRDRGESRALAGRMDADRHSLTGAGLARSSRTACRSRSSPSSSSSRSRRSSRAGSARAAGESALDLLTDPLTREVLWFTTWLAAASTVLTVAVALPASYVLGRYAFPGRTLVLALVTVPFVLPTVVVALAFLAILPERARARTGRDSHRARVLQRRGRRPHRRHVLGRARPQDVGGRRDARRRPAAAAPPRDASAARARALGRGRDRLPVLVHVLRGDRHPRRAALLDARGGDLQPGRALFDLHAAADPLARPARVRRR